MAYHVITLQVIINIYYKLIIYIFNFIRRIIDCAIQINNDKQANISVWAEDRHLFLQTKLTISKINDKQKQSSHLSDW